MIKLLASGPATRAAHQAGNRGESRTRRRTVRRSGRGAAQGGIRRRIFRRRRYSTLQVSRQQLLSRRPETSRLPDRRYVAARVPDRTARIQKSVEREMTLAKYMVGSIDDDGYLRRNLSSISDDIAFSLGIETSGGARTHPAGDPPVGAGGDRFAQPAGEPVAANERARGLSESRRLARKNPGPTTSTIYEKTLRKS